MFLSRVAVSVWGWRRATMISRYILVETDDTYLWAAAWVGITVILVVLVL
jgi:hypothetical protein